MKKKQKDVTPRRHRKIRRLSDDTPFAIREAFNKLRTNILYTPNNGVGCPIYGITSAEMAVGKSTIAANLAISLSQSGKKVLLIDGDMRCPSQHKIFDCEKDRPGLSELLAGIAHDDKAIMLKPNPNLFVLTSGCIPPNPSELLMSKKFDDYIKRWKYEYDLIFIDFPPVGIVTDPITVTTHLSGFIFVAMVNRSDATRVKHAISAIEHVGGKIIGLVLNGSNRRGSAKSKYGPSKYSYKYDYYYGYSYEYSK